MQTGCDSDRLSLYYDNMLPQDEMEAMKLHIEQCPHCTKWLAECSALSALLQEEMNPPADFSGRVLEGLPPQDKKIQTISSWRPVISFVGLAACAAIVFGLSPQTIDPTPDMIPRSTVELPSSPIVDDGASMSSSTMTEQTPPAYEYPDTDAPPPADMSPALDT
ncbi:MAG: zf-HC2 domain-containing protein, partial [Eubacteriales bacterium]